MNGKIIKSGTLFIERDGKLKSQGCPTKADSDCGDWCALFGEPTISKWIGGPDPNEKDRELNPKHWNLQLCRRTLYFDELIDERKHTTSTL